MLLPWRRQASRDRLNCYLDVARAAVLLCSRWRAAWRRRHLVGGPCVSRRADKRSNEDSEQRAMLNIRLYHDCIL